MVAVQSNSLTLTLTIAMLCAARSKLPDFTGKKQQRCQMCNQYTSWYCVECSEGKHALVPICPEVTVARKGPRKGEPQHHRCLCR